MANNDVPHRQHGRLGTTYSPSRDTRPRQSTACMHAGEFPHGLTLFDSELVTTMPVQAVESAFNRRAFCATNDSCGLHVRGSVPAGASASHLTRMHGVLNVAPRGFAMAGATIFHGSKGVRDTTTYRSRSSESDPRRR